MGRAQRFVAATIKTTASKFDTAVVLQPAGSAISMAVFSRL
jgi:hypothetical protein